ncbi:MAG: coenzyme F430 synthase [Methanosarcinaceae archaeon]|nr:coenzyme F430 synthase [Methanosarcinaceae archaeon]
MTAGQKNAAVLDLTHGGIIIAQRMAQLGYNVSAIDVYNTVDPATLADLQDFNIQTSKTPIPVDEFDMIVAPVHLDPNYEMLQQARDRGTEIVTHHKIVGKILSQDKRIAGAKIIEITGTKAKTSTASILADMLSHKLNVVLHTTRGLEYWENGTASLIYQGLSIAPGNILHAVDKTALYISSKSKSNSNIAPDVYIFEVSIGGTGYADIGILTTLTQDYKIANNTAWASDAKMQMLDNAKPGSTVIINYTDDAATGRNLSDSVKTVTFSDSNDCTGDVTLALDEDTIIINSGNWMSVVNAKPGYDIESYTTAMVAAATAALEMGVELDIIRDTLADFEGLSGRMREQVFEGKTLIDNSNSGMNITSVEKSLAYASILQIKKKCRIIMVLGEEAAQVCEGLPPEDVSGFLLQQGKNIDELVLVGERMHAVKHENAHHADSLSQGLSVASGIAGANDLILSCVKCFR